ncbi:hypothetical protein PR003_g2852 [Phytophthora rubi]|uniref:Copine C-terminal domain-containing protein n=1 Tax=Phytophthora rubi TaxID=129364 RepID=A0A6A3NZZ5_9STRA|nr:hypothetical protein PR002_g2684 [Phytophthora rubi]KAE9050272.1 hypothetical protein PR001_g2562 [Phytophthora rubi]KAE9355447.1 hypothetical protein PR003_g2852 [Phytophthora rubi]
MSSSEHVPPGKPAPLLRAISDHFRDFGAIQEALRSMNLESSNMMFAIDYTTANLTNGEQSFGGKCLHALDPSGETLNPYQEALTRLGRVLVEFDDDRSIQVSGFGDSKTPENALFSFTPENPMGGCKSFNEIWQRYHDLTPTIALGNKPVNLGPSVGEREPCRYRAGDCRRVRTAALDYCDGPWDNMKVLDDQLPQRQFDNFNFVSFQKVRHTATEERKVFVHRIQDDNAEPTAAPCELDPLDLLFTLQIMMEVPAQYNCMCKLNLL